MRAKNFGKDTDKNHGKQGPRPRKSFAKAWSENRGHDSPRFTTGVPRGYHGLPRGYHGGTTVLRNAFPRSKMWPCRPFSIRKHQIRPKITKTLPTPQFLRPIRQKKRQTRKNTNVNKNMKSLQKLRQNPKNTHNYENCQTF